MQSDRERLEPKASEALLRDSEFAQETHAELRALARLVIGDDHLAEDVVQDAWIVALQQPARTVFDLRGWLRAVVRRTARDQRRTRRRRGDILKGLVHATRTSDDTSPGDDATQARELVRDAIERLNEPYKRVIELRFLEECSIEEIASKLQRRASTVRSQISRGVAELRALLDRRHGDRSQWSLVLLALARERTPLSPQLAQHAARRTSAASPLVWLGAAACVALILGVVWLGSRSSDRSSPVLVAEADAGESTRVAARSATNDPMPATERRSALVAVVAQPAIDAAPLAPAAPRRLVVHVLRADGSPGSDVSVLVGRTIGQQRTFTAEHSPVVVELAPADLERINDADAVHVVARAAGEAESPLASVLLPGGERQVSLTTRGPAQTIHFRIEDDAGSPIPGARISVGPAGRVGRTEPESGVFLTDRVARVETDARGECSLAQMPRTRRAVRVAHPDFMDFVQETVLGDSPLELRVVLARGAEVAGRVIRPDGLPAANIDAHVEDMRHFLSSGHVRSTKTDASGRFALRGLAPDAETHIFAHDPADPALFASCIVVPRAPGAAGSSSTATSGGSVEVELRLATHAGLTLRIVDEHGAPLLRRRVILFDPKGTAPFSLIEFTDELGLVRFRHVPSIPLDVMIERGFGDTPVIARGVLSSADEQQLEFVSDRTLRGGLFGAVVGVDGQPIAGAQMLGSRDGELFRVDLDRRDGSFRAQGLQPGTFELYATTPRTGTYGLGDHRVHASIDTDIGVVRLPSPVIVDLTWGATTPSETEPWRVRFAPSDEADRAIEASLLTDPLQAPELLPGNYMLVPPGDSTSAAAVQRFTVPPEVARFKLEVSAR